MTEDPLPGRYDVHNLKNTPHSCPISIVDCE